MSIFYLQLRRRQLFTRLSEQSDVSSTVGKVMMKTVHKRLVNNQQVQKRRLVTLPPQQEVWKSCGGESSAYTFVRKEGTPKSTGASSFFRINVPFGRYTSMLRCYAATLYIHCQGTAHCPSPAQLPSCTTWMLPPDQLGGHYLSAIQDRHTRG